MIKKERHQAILDYVHTSGLTNRLRGLVGIGAVSEVLKMPLKLRWQPDHACPARYSDLFEPVCDLAAPGSERGKPWFVFRGNQGPTGSTRPWLHYHEFVVDLCLVPEFGRLCRSWAGKIQLVPSLRHLVEEAVARWPVGVPVYGVHVRRTDMCAKINSNVSDLALRSRLLSLAYENPDAHFFLSTDNAESRNEVLRMLGDRVILSEAKFKRKGLRLTSLQDAAVDLYTLARTAQIIGTKNSSFSTYAAHLGNIPLERI